MSAPIARTTRTKPEIGPAVSSSRLPCRTAASIVAGIFLALVPAAPLFAGEIGATQKYLYEDTKRLVMLVEDAAALIEEEGRSAFDQFVVRSSRWFNGDEYLFVYAPDGTCLFHPVTPEIIGKNLIDFRDMLGKPAIELITAVCRRGERDASAWVFYLWGGDTAFLPRWKSSYVRKAVMPDGTVCVVGCGIYNMKIEKSFVQDAVDAAAELLTIEGKEAAFRAFRDPGSIFRFHDSFVFVIDGAGKMVLDPTFPTISGRDLSKLEDAVGHRVINEALGKLAKTDRVWVQYMWPKQGGIRPAKKLAYFRKVVVAGETFIVGCDYFVATPIWMKQ